MLVTLAGMVTEVRLLQKLNAFMPMSVTLSGIVMDVMFLHQSNALSPIMRNPLRDRVFAGF